MMMTGRVYNAEDGERAGFAQYLVPEACQAFDKALRAGTNALHTTRPLTNYALMHALPRIAEQPADHGFFTEAHDGRHCTKPRPEAKERVREFLEGRGGQSPEQLTLNSLL